VFVEKPLAPTVDECRQVQCAAEDHNRTVGVDHSLLADPFTVQAQRKIARGAIGRVVAVDCFRSHQYPEYMGGEYPEYARNAGFAFRDLGIHALYQIEAFLGPIHQLKWLLEQHGRDPLQRFDEWRVVASCERGTAQFQLSCNVRPPQDLIVVQGTEGVLRIDRYGMSVTVKRSRRFPEHPERAINALCEGLQQTMQVPWSLARVATKQLRRYHGLQAMVAEFYDALRAGRPPAASVEDATRIAHWLELVASDADRRGHSSRDRLAQQLTGDTLVTGATGFIGGHLVRRLLSEGRHVRVLCRRPPPDELADNPQVETVLGDLGHPATVDRAVAGVNTVYHVGATVHGTSAEFWRGTVVGTENIVESCLRHGVKQLVYVSSLSVLQAIGQEGRLTDEAAPLEPFADRRGLYTQTKLAAEQIVVRAARDRSLPVAIVRPGEVVDNGAPRLSSGIGQRRGDRVVVFGDGNQHVPLVHVEDVIDAMRECEDRRVRDGSIFHLVDPQLVTQNELLQQYCQLTRQRLKVHYWPRALVLALGLAVQTAFLPLRRTPPVSLYRLRSAMASRQFDISRAQRRLDWRPRRGVSWAPIDTSHGSASGAVRARAAEVERVS
jgi:nucleoside-diphosphate-sugar epimerase/predicted dehydrogenase